MAGLMPGLDFASSIGTMASQRMQLPEGTVTLMIMSVPRRHTADEVLQEIGFWCDLTSCELFNLPRDLKGKSNIGYAFISFTSTDAAETCASALNGRPWRLVQQRAVCGIRASRVQGMTANLELFVKNADPARLQAGHVLRIFLNQRSIELNDAVEMFCSPRTYHELLQKQDPRQQMSRAMPWPARLAPPISASLEESTGSDVFTVVSELTLRSEFDFVQRAFYEVPIYEQEVRLVPAVGAPMPCLLFFSEHISL